MKRILPHKRLLCLTLSLAVSACLTAAVATAKDTKLHDAVKPASRNDKWWTDRHVKMNQRVAQGNVDMLLIGDSITHAWETGGKGVWDTYYAPRNAVNLGIGGDRTQHVLWRLDNGNIKGISPKLAMLMIGTNNSGDNSSEEIADGVTAIVAKLRKKLPATKVLILAIFPRGASDADALRQTNMKANKIIAKLANGSMVSYLDIGDKFLADDRTLSKKVMPDLLHLTPDSYKTWAEAVEPAVAKVMGPLKQKSIAPTESCPRDESGFVPLFDGKSLAGWRKAGGGATYSVDDGCIVGRVGPGPNTFLCTEKNYGDFILKVDVKLDIPGNSGIQFRSHQREKDGRVFGYQCEIDESPRSSSGGIYDESRRGWLCDLKDNEKGRQAFKLKDWNQFVIKAQGHSIKTWINGVACADLTDKADADGFIALQVHSGKQGQIRWRNVRIKQLAKGN